MFNHVSNEASNNAEEIIELEVNGKNMIFEVDCSACVTVIPEYVYREKLEYVELKSTNASFFHRMEKE